MLRSAARQIASPALKLAARDVSSLAIASLESRWPKLPEAEQGAIAETIYAKERGDWREMSLDEKRASYFIAYGDYAARTPRNPTHKYRVAGWVAFIFLTSVGLWQWWMSAMKPELVTDTKEWKEATARLDLERKMNPFQNGPYPAERAKIKAEKKL